MKTYRTLTTVGGLFLAASLSLAQYAPAAPPAPPTPPAAQAPVAPTTPPRPASAVRPEAMFQDALDALNLAEPAMATAMAQMDFQEFAQDKAIARADEAMARANARLADVQFRFDGLKAPVAMQTARAYTIGSKGGEDGLYQNGLNLIDSHQYEQALSDFNNVVARAGARAEGALYWKAYVLNKLGRAADAQGALDALRKTYPSSRWLDDAKALELEVKQSKGPVSPESETDEDIKILALNGLMQSDPEKALPQVENMLKASHSPRLKRQALVVIAQNNTPRAQQDLEQIARGGNPDLQLRAIQFLGSKRNPNNPQLLVEIYAASNDAAVKQAILNTFSSTRDKDRLVQILKGEKDERLRASVIGRLGDVDGQPELWQIYQGETTAEGRIMVLDVMRRNGNLEKLAEVARTDKDPKVRQAAIRVIASQEAGTPSATLISLYNGEQDEKVKQTIVDSLSSSRNCKPLVDVAKTEKDVKLKLRIVERLAGMAKSCKEATDYLQELLSR